MDKGMDKGTASWGTRATDYASVLEERRCWRAGDISSDNSHLLAQASRILGQRVNRW